MLNWYYQKKSHAEIWARNKNDMDNRHSAISVQINSLQQRKNAIEKGIENGKDIECTVASKQVSTSYINVDDPQQLNLSSGQIVMAYISTFGFVMLAISAMGIYQSFVSACVFALIYGVAIPFFLQRKRFVNSCFGWTIITASVTVASIIGGMAYGAAFFKALNWAPMMLVAGAAIGVLIILIIMGG